MDFFHPSPIPHYQNYAVLLYWYLIISTERPKMWASFAFLALNDDDEREDKLTFQHGYYYYISSRKILSLHYPISKVIRISKHSYTNTHTNAQTHTQTHRHSHTHTHTHTHTRKHTYANRNRHSNPFSRIKLPFFLRYVKCSRLNKVVSKFVKDT